MTCTPANDNDCLPPPNKCLMGKIKCVSKKKSCLLKEEAKARASGTAPSAFKIQNCKNKFDGGPDQSDLAPEKGCFGLQARAGEILLRADVEDSHFSDLQRNADLTAAALRAPRSRRPHLLQDQVSGAAPAVPA
jgi:hypothetical protein